MVRSHTMNLRLIYRNNTQLSLSWSIRHKTNQILINKNTMQPKCYLPENDTEALQLGGIQIMASVYSFVKALHDLEYHPVYFWLFGFYVLCIHILFSLSYDAAVVLLWHEKVLLILIHQGWKESGMFLPIISMQKKNEIGLRSRWQVQNSTLAPPVFFVSWFLVPSALKGAQLRLCLVSQPVCFFTSGSAWPFQIQFRH